MPSFATFSHLLLNSSLREPPIEKFYSLNFSLLFLERSIVITTTSLSEFSCFLIKMPWSRNQKAFCVKVYLSSKSYKCVRKEFQRTFKQFKSPSKSLIYCWVQKFENDGTVHNLNSKASGGSYSGRPVTARTPQKIGAVQDSAKDNPKKSIRKRGQELSISRSSLQRILTLDLKLRAYHIQLKQLLTQDDRTKRLQMCQWFLEKIDNDPNFLKHVWFSDEAHFHLNGSVNSKNCVHWGEHAPDEVLEKSLHSKKCTAWAAISSHGIIGPLWFEDEFGQTKTVDTDGYLQVLDTFWRELNLKRLPKNKQWFQQDGATPHTAARALHWIQERFGERVMSRRCAIEWAPHSPDLTPPDFFLWGHLKGRVYSTNPQTIQEIKRNVERETRQIDGDVLKRVIANFTRRLAICVQRGGGHLEHKL